MSFLDKLKKKKEELQQKVIEIKVDASIRTDRLNQCNNCEHLFKVTRSCLKCGCFVDAKTWLKNEECPLKKW